MSDVSVNAFEAHKNFIPIVFDKVIPGNHEKYVYHDDDDTSSDSDSNSDADSDSSEDSIEFLIFDDDDVIVVMQEDDDDEDYSEYGLPGTMGVDAFALYAIDREP
ncbi:PREDICTED: nucleosome-remodeling factor subunit BPTF-like [Nicrophorus vespilloides]|uniref:Nucleosome-remodeling factor subunit BPTF-like n=1 Tax=Nicrophorus vespilloides TaxID=110193 RepID=A0ABM1M2T6_NICVS|nr:PREDICTED: nucleosome-remodeling factor subunit BPTF-like [Nicrophorus vespilloides]